MELTGLLHALLLALPWLLRVPMPGWGLERLMLSAGTFKHPTVFHCRSLPGGSGLFVAGSWRCAAPRSALACVPRVVTTLLQPGQAGRTRG